MKIAPRTAVATVKREAKVASAASVSGVISAKNDPVPTRVAAAPTKASPAIAPFAALPAIARRHSRLIWIIFGKIGCFRIEAEGQHQCARRHAAFEQILGDKQAIDVGAIFKSRQTRKGKPNIGERLVTAPPLLGSAFNVPEHIGRNGPTIGCREQGDNALPVGIKVENRRAALILSHSRKNGAGAEDEPRIIDLDRIADREAP